MRRLLPEPAADIPEGALRDAFAFPEQTPWLRGSMVSSLDGAMRGRDGSSRSVASAADRRVFSLLRMSSDVILVGAGTIRAERYRPSKKPIAVVTARLGLTPDLPLFSAAPSGGPRTLVLTTDEAAASAPTWLTWAADVIACGPGEVDLARGASALTERGLVRIHCEGGPRLLGSLAEAGLLDELLLTISPILTGAPDRERILSVPGGFDPARRLELSQVLEEDGTVFLRARRAS